MGYRLTVGIFYSALIIQSHIPFLSARLSAGNYAYCKAFDCRRIEAPIGTRELNMGWIIAIIVGGVAGWLASKIMNRDASMGIVWNVIVGIVGSVIGNVIAQQFGWAGSIQEFSIVGLVIALIGAIVLLAIVNLVQRGKVR